MKKKGMKGNNKGFTLVELIVVLVILAILAAILVPALLGYIDSARNKQTLLNARSAMTAAQAELSAIYGSKAEPSAIVKPAEGKTSTHNQNLCNTADFSKLSPTPVLFEVGCKAAYDNGENAEPRNKQHDAFTVVWVHYQDESAEVWYNGVTGEWLDSPLEYSEVVKDAGDPYLVYGTKKANN